MEMTYENNQPYNDMQDREDQQVMIDEWCNQNRDDHKHDFAGEWLNDDREAFLLLTENRDEAIRTLSSLRVDFDTDYEEHLQNLAKEELFGE